MVKILCPVCNVQGILEVRGNSKRVIHYRYVDGKRIFSRHKVVGTVLGTMGTEKAGYSIINENTPSSSVNQLKDISLEG